MLRTLLQAWILGGCTLLAAAATHLLHPRAPALFLQQAAPRDDEVMLARVAGDWQNQVIWLDARPEEQFRQEHIPGAYPLNEQQFDSQLVELFELLQTAERPVVIYCSGERCEAARRVRERLLQIVPLERCFILKGGWPAWKAAQP